MMSSAIVVESATSLVLVDHAGTVHRKFESTSRVETGQPSPVFSLHHSSGQGQQGHHSASYWAAKHDPVP
jgi:hypothetical protein